MYKIPNFVKVSKDSVLYNDSGTFNLYVPERYFELSAAKYAGSYIELLGICNYAIEKNGKIGELHEFYIPTVFTTKPHDVEKLKDVHLTMPLNADTMSSLKNRLRAVWRKSIR